MLTSVKGAEWLALAGVLGVASLVFVATSPSRTRRRATAP